MIWNWASGLGRPFWFKEVQWKRYSLTPIITVAFTRGRVCRVHMLSLYIQLFLMWWSEWWFWKFSSIPSLFFFLSPLQVYTTSYPSLQQINYRRRVVVYLVYREVNKMRLRYQVSLRRHELEPESTDPDDPRRKFISGLPVHTPTEADKAMAMTPQPFCIGDKFYVPLKRIIAYPRLGYLCGNVQELRELLADSIELNCDASAVKVDLYHCSDYCWPALVPEIQGLSNSWAHLKCKLGAVIIEVASF